MLNTLVENSAVRQGFMAEVRRPQRDLRSAGMAASGVKHSPACTPGMAAQDPGAWARSLPQPGCCHPPATHAFILP